MSAANPRTATHKAHPHRLSQPTKMKTGANFQLKGMPTIIYAPEYVHRRSNEPCSGTNYDAPRLTQISFVTLPSDLQIRRTKQNAPPRIRRSAAGMQERAQAGQRAYLVQLESLGLKQKERSNQREAKCGIC